MTANFRSTLCIAALLLVGGCKTQREITTFEQLRSASPGPIKALAKDSSLYEFEAFTILDSAIVGAGKVVRNETWHPFTGQVRYADLVYLQAAKTDYFRGLLFCTVLGFTASWAGSAAHEDGLRIWRPSPAGGSCPYVYVWDGERYAIQGEVFGTAFGRALETSTQCMLPAAVAREKSIQIHLTNERPETHYVNSVRLLGFRAPSGSEVLLDPENRAWPVSNPLPPLQSPGEISRPDDIWWASDLARTRNGGDFRDVVELTMPRAPGADSGSLVLRVINTRVFDAVYEVVFGFLGTDQLPFLYQLEHDRELIGLLRGWIEECGLTVEVWKGGKWQKAGVIAPEANEVPFSRIIRLDATGMEDETMRIRLTSLADTWKIDAVEVDWTPAAPLPPSILPLRSARHSFAGPVEGQINTNDARYSMVLPGERIDLEFDMLAPEGGEQVAYAFEAGGYLYEWMPEAPKASGVPAMFARYAPDRLAVVNFLLRQREAFLSIVYARWSEGEERARAGR